MKIVIALGGNALGDTPTQQLELVKNTAHTIVDLVEMGHQVIIGHGNGPQVGTINLAFNEASKTNPKVVPMPFPEYGAMSQGYIGYHVQQAVRNELSIRKLPRDVVCLVTQVEVDSEDPAFKNPTKPIGGFYTYQQVQNLNPEDVYIEDSGRGYRKVVPSPKPINIVELNTINSLVKQNSIVITVGGGGIPVVKKDNQYAGVEAVIDKDHSCAKLAIETKADLLLILTAVDHVAINFNKPDQMNLENLDLNTLNEYIQQGQFAKGSMLPKIEACQNFLLGNPQGKAIITSLEKAASAIKGETGTHIVY